MSGDIIEVLQRIADTPPISPSRTSRTLQTNAGEGPGIEPLPSRGHRERLNPDLETILLKALAQTPERRYQSAGDMARDVRHYLGGEPIEARGDSTWYALKMGVRRYKWPVAAAALFILLISGSAIALALLYGRQGRLLVEVKQQKTLAQHRFEDVRSLARTLIFGLENDLSATHISATARAFLVNTALKYMNTLAQDTPPNDTQLMGELGAAYFSLGDIQGDPFNTNLGERAGALESYEKGLGYLEAVVNALPMDLDAQRELSVALLRIGTLLESMGRREEAQGHFRRAYQLTDRLIPIHPDDRGLQRDHVMNQRIMADYELSDGHVEESLALFESALKATESMAQADTDNENLQHDLAAINGKIGKVLELMGKSTEPLKYRQHSLEILGTLVATYPKNNRYQHDLATAHDRVGIVLQRSGDLKGALEHFQQGLTIDEKLVERDPLNAPARAGLRTQHCRIGEIRLSQGEMAAALESFERYQRESRRCAEIEPDNAAVLRDLAVSYYKMAEFEKARANDTSPSIEERRGCWKRASQRFGECRIVFIDMKNRGLLSERDRGVTDTLTLEIAACDNERKRLEQSKPLD